MTNTSGSDEMTALKAQYRQAYDLYLATWQEADALEVKATLKRQEAQIIHERMKELSKKIDLIFEEQIKNFEEQIDLGR